MPEDIQLVSSSRYRWQTVNTSDFPRLARTQRSINHCRRFPVVDRLHPASQPKSIGSCSDFVSNYTRQLSLEVDRAHGPVTLFAEHIEAWIDAPDSDNPYFTGNTKDVRISDSYMGSLCKSGLCRLLPDRKSESCRSGRSPSLRPVTNPLLKLPAQPASDDFGRGLDRRSISPSNRFRLVWPPRMTAGLRQRILKLSRREAWRDTLRPGTETPLKQTQRREVRSTQLDFIQKLR